MRESIVDPNASDRETSSSTSLSGVRTTSEEHHDAGGGMPAELLSRRQGFALAIGLAAVTIGGILLLSDQRRLEALALILAVTVAAYVGFALAERSARGLAVELVAAAALGALILLGLWASPYWLVAGYFGHGVWDLAHHPARLGTRLVPAWYVSACLVYDWIVAGLILVLIPF